MRVIEPPRGAKRPKRPSGNHVKPWRGYLVVLAVFTIGGLYLLLGQKVELRASYKQVQESSKVIRENAAASTRTYTTLKTFTGAEFKSLYSASIYPNTQQFPDPPYITGNSITDARIRDLAEARGYKQTAIPVANIVKTDERDLRGDDLIQQKALLAWRELKENALKDGLVLNLSSAYRSPEYQRDLFLNRLRAYGVTNDQVANGYVDAELNMVLSQAAIPGYSRHHTGYTIDVMCNQGTNNFESTDCFKWLSANNYEKAKTFGWIPSYPEEATGQGPEPEAWEYVWVGKDATYSD